ncbi:hypothetical protein RUM43_010177 [Polyplax serrata]|uniref:Lipase domain-containing protein n=1 Tax=Polyplax serrata TaxID=468196 RepID=A0AAN8P8V0_POLSC
MEPIGYITLLLLIFVITIGLSGNIARGKAVDDDDEDSMSKYVAQDEINEFKHRLHMFGEEYGKSWLVMPNGDGEPNFAFISDAELENLIEDGDERSENDLARANNENISKSVKFYFYTKDSRDGVEITPEDLKEIEFDSSRPTKIITHGWMASSKSSAVADIRDAYLDHQDVNVIGVDWSDIANNFWYPTPASKTDDVGKYLGNLIDELVTQKNANYDNIHLVGHSLGAHVSGFAGSSTQGKIGRITGLDPALPGFQFSTYVKVPEERLDRGDADFVDVIHTCAGVLGMSITVGHADFFPNGGSPFQPGCKEKTLPTSTQACSHGRSHELFAESIKHKNFKAVGCSDWEHFKDKKCKNIYTNMGEYATRDIRGAFYLKTEGNSPFALGLNGTFY